ncbi:jerky-like protein [Trichonephila clavipes]|nr:jerky-like protein [Trichonephila clavipes]
MASNSKQKHNVLNIETKLEILNCLTKGESGASLAQFRNVGKSTISEIKKSRETILNFASKLHTEDGSKKRKTMGKQNDVLLDHALYLWFSQRRKEDPISCPHLCKKVLELNEKLGSSADFKDSTG